MTKVARFLDKCIAYLGYLGAAMGVISLVIMTLLITVGVALRYFFNRPLLYVEEFSAYLLVAVVFLGFAYTMRADAHINVELVVTRLPQRVRQGLELLTSLLALVVIGIYLWYAWKFWLKSLSTEQMSITGLLPLWIPQILLWVGLILFGLEIATRIVKKFIVFRKGFKQGISERMPGAPSE